MAPKGLKSQKEERLVAEAVFSICYLGPLRYYAALLSYRKVAFEACENFSKQSYRNRCYLGGPNGRLMLNLPLLHSAERKISAVKLSFHENWPAKHWQALQSCYGQTPFWEALAPELAAVYQNPPAKLWDFNLQLTELMLHFLRKDLQWEATQSWEEQPGLPDWRAHFHPKKPQGEKLPPYPQVFAHKHGFLVNLSVLDLLCNEGPAAYDYLRSISTVR